MNPAHQWKCTEAEYNEDNRVRSSSLKTALTSPAEYHARYVSRTMTDEFTKALILGSVTHCLTLEPDQFDKRYAVRPPGIDGRTADGKKALAAHRLSALGKIDLDELVGDSQALKAQAQAMADAVLREPVVRDLIAIGTKETALVWTDDETGLECKMRSDLFVPRPLAESDLLLDLKSSADPSPESWTRGGMFAPVPKYRYDLSGAHYVDGMTRFTNRPCHFGLIVVGSRFPYDVFLYDLTAWLPIGETYRRKALRAVAAGMKTNTWRHPQQGTVIELKPGQWDIPREESDS